MTKPEPLSTHIVCSQCGLTWALHGKEPTLEKCVELLKGELARRPTYQTYTIPSATGPNFPSVWQTGSSGLSR